MVTKVIQVITFTFILLVSSSGVKGQNICNTNIGTAIENDVVQDSLYVVYSEQEAGITLRILNTTTQVYYLFSSYFSSPFYSARYIHRISQEEQVYKISFVPLVPYLATKRSDRIILGNQKMVSKNQVLYDFIRLKPDTYYELTIPYSDLFKNINEKENLVYDFDASQKNKFEAIDFKYLSLNDLKGNYKLLFEFGIYNDVNLLCSQEAYYMQEHKFNDQAKSFKTLKVPIQINNYKHPLF